MTNKNEIYLTKLCSLLNTLNSCRDYYFSMESYDCCGDDNNPVIFVNPTQQSIAQCMQISYIRDFLFIETIDGGYIGEVTLDKTIDDATIANKIFGYINDNLFYNETWMDNYDLEY